MTGDEFSTELCFTVRDCCDVMVKKKKKEKTATTYQCPDYETEPHAKNERRVEFSALMGITRL